MCVKALDLQLPLSQEHRIWHAHSVCPVLTANTGNITGVAAGRSPQRKEVALLSLLCGTDVILCGWDQTYSGSCFAIKFMVIF